MLETMNLNASTPAVLKLDRAARATMRLRVSMAVRVRRCGDGTGLADATIGEALEALTGASKVTTYGLVRGTSQAVEQIVIVPFPDRKGSPLRFVVDLIPVISV